MSRTAHRLRVLEAAATLLLVGVILKTLPFRKVARLAGAAAPGLPAGGATRDPAAQAVGHAVAVAAQRLPWKPLCLPQALTASLMLRRRWIKSRLCVGVQRQGAMIQAHAWVTVDGPAGGVVCGGHAAELFVPIATVLVQRGRRGRTDA